MYPNFTAHELETFTAQQIADRFKAANSTVEGARAMMFRWVLNPEVTKHLREKCASSFQVAQATVLRTAMDILLPAT